MDVDCKSILENHYIKLRSQEDESVMAEQQNSPEPTPIHSRSKNKTYKQFLIIMYQK